MEKADCIYPDCLIRTSFGRSCEHSCPFEKEQKVEGPPDNYTDELKRAAHRLFTSD